MSVPRLRAPAEHGQILAVPPFDQVRACLERNRHTFRSVNTPELSLGGKSLNGVRELARREVLAAATQYHLEAGQPVPQKNEDVWLVAGHQPELFHPGVWFKNFVLHRLARANGATSLNLIVDTDAAKPAILHVPAVQNLSRVVIDRASPDAPYEERTVQDETLFAGFPERLAATTASWGFEPMLKDFWREVMQHAPRTPLLGERFAAARRAFERRWGVVQLEVPMSRVCQTTAFAWFVGRILSELPRFHAVYNDTVQEYRRQHGIRSRSHPVPDLARDGDWLEAPFWAWRHGQARRGKLFLQATPHPWVLRFGAADRTTIAVGDLDALHGLEAQGFKVRSRALTTTMFARLFLADLFLHGIGGGIYDELTDRILARFFGIPAPAYMIVSATLLLPLQSYPDATQQASMLERRLRDLTYKPELFIQCSDDVDPLIRAKKDWIERKGATHAERVERFERIREINGCLLPGVVPEMERVRKSLDECNLLVEMDSVARRRDYAFCLYPEEMLREFFVQDPQESLRSSWGLGK